MAYCQESPVKKGGSKIAIDWYPNQGGVVKLLVASTG